MQIPARRRSTVLKVAGLLGLVVTLLLLFDIYSWSHRHKTGEKNRNIWVRLQIKCPQPSRGGQRSVAFLPNREDDEFEQQIREDEARIVSGLGDGGVGVDLTGKEKEIGEESVKNYTMNVYLSDRMPYDRKLRDDRSQACKQVLYDAELPSCSVVVIFRNEPYSVLLRTIWSVLNSVRRNNYWFKRANFIDANTGKSIKNIGYPGQDPSSQFVYLVEIILVDDNSTLPELKGKLSHYVRTRLPPDLIRILRLPDHVGLIRAKLAGARAARGRVLVFLDAHCEAVEDWLRPLLQRVKQNRTTITTPFIEVSGFSFNGESMFIPVPEREQRRRGSVIAPTRSPTMAGGLFAIDRQYFWELGGYDDQMSGYGGENLEMSFRIWMCGGTIETIPCSRVAHVYRTKHFLSTYNEYDFDTNTARMAVVWMDDYKELYFIYHPDLSNNKRVGDVSQRTALREKLKCQSFDWYLDNIYKEKFVPTRDATAFGRFTNPDNEFCLDTLQRHLISLMSGPAVEPTIFLAVHYCQPMISPSQFFMLSNANELRDETMCALMDRKRDKAHDEAGYRVQISVCITPPTADMTWNYLPTFQLQHESSGLCLDAGSKSNVDVLLRPCSTSPTQIWKIEYILVDIGS